MLEKITFGIANRDIKEGEAVTSDELNSKEIIYTKSYGDKLHQELAIQQSQNILFEKENKRLHQMIEHYILLVESMKVALEDKCD